jgi:hypothetical protein
MKALVYDGPGKIEYRDHPMPTLQADTDIVMKISESTKARPRSIWRSYGPNRSPSPLVFRLA